MKGFLCLGLLGLLAACGSSDKSDTTPMPMQGAEGQACYPNGTCDAGLSCLSKLCVAAPMNTGGSNASAGTSPGGSAGSGGGGSANAGTGGSAGGGTDPVCVTKQVKNATASEKVNAAFCYGLGINDEFSCNFNSAANETRCIGTNFSYVVTYSEQNGVTVGDIYNLDTGDHIGQVIQGPTGSFDFTIDSGLRGSCTVNGDVATLCHDPA